MAANGVLVTRPAGQGDALCKALAGRGWRAHPLPLLALQPLARLPAAERQRVLALAEFEHVIFISANAVRFGMAVIENYWPQLPVGLHWYAVGAGTARALAAYGISARAPEREMTSEGLLALPGLQQVAGARILIVKGVGGRNTLLDALGVRGARVETLACYRRCPPDMRPGELAAAVERWQIGVIMISSGEGLENMLALLDRAETSKLQALTLLLPSARVAAMARAAGFRHITVAENASDEAMLHAFEQWCLGTGEKL